MDMQNWLLGGGLAIMIGILGVMLRVSFKIGGDARDLAEGLKRIEKVELRLEQIAIHNTRLGTLEELYKSTHSDIKELRLDIKQLHQRPGSRPDYDEGDT